jgi:O-antigen/teichoic acid export membrane protein
VVVFRAAGCAPRWNLASLVGVLRYGLKSYLTVILQLTERKADMFLLGWLLPSGIAAWQIGLYSTAVALAELPRNLAGAASTVLLPRISASDQDAIKATVPRVSRNLIAANVVFALALALCARPLIGFVYGPAFLPSYLPFLVLLPGVVFAGVLNVFEAEMVGTGQPLKLSAFAGLTLVLNIVLNLIAIPRWGILGAAATSGVTYSLLAVLLVLDYRARNRGVSLRDLLLVSRSDVSHYLTLVRRSKLVRQAATVRTTC